MIEESGNGDSQWDNRLANSGFGTIFQSSLYANYVERCLGAKPTFVRFRDGEETLGQLLCYRGVRIFPFSTWIPTVVARGLSSATKAGFYQWIYGPVSVERGGDRVVARQFGEFIRGISKGLFSGVLASHGHPLLNYEAAFDGLGFSKLNVGTFLIDLNKTEDDLWRAISKGSGRSTVTRAMKNGVTARLIDRRNDLKTYCSLVNERRAASGEERLGQRDLQGLKDALGEHVKFFLVERGSEPLACATITEFAGYINEILVGQSKNDVVQGHGGGDLLQWEIIKWARAAGHTCYDMSGVHPETSDEKLRGIFRFKKKWGGRLVLYSRFSKLPRITRPFRPVT